MEFKEHSGSLNEENPGSKMKNRLLEDGATSVTVTKWQGIYLNLFQYLRKVIVQDKIRYVGEVILTQDLLYCLTSLWLTLMRKAQ